MLDRWISTATTLLVQSGKKICAKAKEVLAFLEVP